MPFWRRGRQFPPSLPQYNFLNIKLMFKVANWNATGHWGPTHQWLPAILSSIHLFFPEDISQFSEVTFSGGLRRLTTLLHSLFRNCPCDTINLPPYYSLSTSFRLASEEDEEKGNIYRDGKSEIARKSASAQAKLANQFCDQGIFVIWL